MTRFKLWASLALVAGVTIAGLGAWWQLDLRWRPKTITKHQAEIAHILEEAGWVSPGLQGPKLYMVSFRSCPDCLRFKTEQFPDLHAAGVDTRVIEVARRDVNGLSRSTPAERATVAELWLGRSWKLEEAWAATPPDAWTAPGIAPADGDMARTAVVEAGRQMVDDLTRLMGRNGVKFAYPLLVWWTKEGKMRACACEKAQADRFVRRDLGLEP